MPKLIKVLHPYEFENINTVNDFLIFSKNIFRTIKKNGCYEKKDGILIPLRWSKVKESWVVDRGTDLNRDIEGISLNNVDLFFSKEEIIYKAIVFILNSVKQNNEFNIIANKFNLVKNDTKFIAFEYTNKTTNIINNKIETAYPIGLFEFCQTKKRKGRYSKNNSELIDNSHKVLEMICNTNKENFSMLNFLTLKESYTSYYNSFLRHIIEKEYNFKSKDTDILLSFKDILEERCLDITNNFRIKEIVKAINDKNMSNYFFRKNKKNIIALLLNVMLGEFIKKEMNIEESEGVVIWDKFSRNFIKLTGDFLLVEKKSFNKKLEEKEIEYSLENIPILPRAF